MKNVKDGFEDVKDKIDDIGDAVSDTVNGLIANAGDLAGDLKDKVVQVLDVNKDGQAGIDDIITIAFKTPGIHVKREAFLRKELTNKFPQEQVEKAIATNPATAGIPIDEIDKIANAVIEQERIFVTGISTALGVPGGLAMVATIPADIIQYYGYTLRAAQKLLYLYGFPEIKVTEEGLLLDAETTNTIILCLGIMYGVAGAANGMKALAKALAKGVVAKINKLVLKKVALYPVIKNICKWFGVRLTRDIIKGVASKSIIAVGGAISGGITFFSFKPCCKKLIVALRDTQLSNPNHVADKEEDEIYYEIISEDDEDHPEE